MAAEENKTIVHRYIEEVVNKGSMAVADELIASNVVLHIAGLPEPIRGFDAFKPTVTSFRAAFPDLHVTIEDLIAEGDKVVARLTVHGTHQGEFLGIPTTGKQVTVTEIQIVRLAFGQIVDMWGNADLLGMLQQLGVLSLSGQTR